MFFSFKWQWNIQHYFALGILVFHSNFPRFIIHMRILYGFVAYIILDGQRIMMDHISSFQPLETQTLQNVDGTTALSKEFC